MFFRIIISFFYMSVLFFSFFFRSFLILYASRGLVVKGCLNLRLFKQLFWLCVMTFIVFFCSNFLTKTMRGESLLKDSARGRACLASTFSSRDFDNNTKRLMTHVMTLLLTIRIVYQRSQVRLFFKGFCPNGKMSSIGDYKRNVITLHNTFWWFLFWMLHTSLSYVVADIGFHVLSAQNLFWTHNFTAMIGYEGFHLIIPLFLYIPSQGSCTKRQFYPRKYVPEPRRPTLKVIAETKVIQVEEQTNRESVLNQVEYKKFTFCYPGYTKLYESFELGV